MSPIRCARSIGQMFWDHLKKKIGQMSRSKGYVPTEKTYHREYSCEISNFSTHYSNVINKGIVFKKGPKSM